MREADLPGTGRDTPSDDRRGRGAVMWRTVRRHGQEPGSRRQRAGDRVYARHLERLVLCQRRQDRRQAAPEHRLAGARRPGEQEVVRARGCELERSAPTLLAADVGEIGQRGRRAGVGHGRRRCDLVVSEQVADRLGQVADPDGLDPGERGFAGGVGRTEHALDPRSRRSFGRGDRPGYRAHAAVEPELPDAHMALEPLGRDLRRSRQDGERDREIEARPLLAERGGREVDRDRAPRPLEERRVDTAPDAMLRLLAGAVREPDDRERGLLARAQMSLDLDAARLEADERERDRAAQHASKLRGGSSRECAVFVPTV